MSTDGPRWRLVRAGTDAVPAWVRRFFATRRRRLPGVRPGRRWAVVAGAGAVVLIAAWLTYATPVLGVHEIRVTGTEVLSAEQVRRAAAVPRRTPLLRVRGDEVAERVATLGPVARVRVGRDWPRTLVIEVVERQPVAVVPTVDGYLLLDAEGVGFHPVAQAPPELPVVVVASPGPDDAATRAAVTVLAALTPPLRERLETLTVAGPAQIELSLSSGLTVLWGDATASEEKARVATALLDHEALPDHDEALIDVSAPEVVAVR